MSCLDVQVAPTLKGYINIDSRKAVVAPGPLNRLYSKVFEHLEAKEKEQGIQPGESIASLPPGARSSKRGAGRRRPVNKLPGSHVSGCLPS